MGADDKKPSQEVLDNLDLLLNIDVIEDEKDWGLLTAYDHSDEWKMKPDAISEEVKKDVGHDQQ
jgi:hypothetical protein